MAKIIRKNQKIFGSNPGINQVGKFGSLAAGLPAFTTDPEVIQELSNYLVGWFGAVVGGNSPAIEDMNAVHFLYAYQLAYLMQTGVAEWNVDTEYYIGSLVNDGNGNLYSSLTDTNLGNVVTDGANWRNVGPNGTIQTENTNYQILAGDKLVLVSANMTATLPDATLVSGVSYEIKKTDSNATTVVVDTLSSQTIDGQLTVNILEQFQFMVVRSDGANWNIVGAG